jgi:hypothetical protein
MVIKFINKLLLALSAPVTILFKIEKPPGIRTPNMTYEPSDYSQHYAYHCHCNAMA